GHGAPAGCAAPKKRQKRRQKTKKRACKTRRICCIIQTYNKNGCTQSDPWEADAMARTRKKAKTLWWAVSRLLFVLLLLSMLAAYISNQVTISSKQAELDSLNEQIAQQQSENEELERILSGDPDDIVEWIARDSYGYAAPNERIIVDISGN